MNKRIDQYAYILIALVLLQGCASIEEANQEREAEAAAAAAAQNPKQTEQIAQLENKISELETRLTALNEKINIENGVKPSANKNNELPTERVQPSAASKNAAVPMPKAISKHSKFAESFQQDESIDRYREAKILFDSNRPADAILEFSEFIKTHPHHAFAPNAQYFVGMGYYQQKEYKLAEEEFSRVLVNYPYSNAVPDALAALATVSEQLGKSARVMYYREKLKGHFANSPQAKSIAGFTPVKHSEPKHVIANPIKPEPPTAPVPEMSEEDSQGVEPSVLKTDSGEHE